MRPNAFFPNIIFFQILENWGLHLHLLAPSFHVNDDGIYVAVRAISLSQWHCALMRIMAKGKLVEKSTQVFGVDVQPPHLVLVQ